LGKRLNCGRTSYSVKGTSNDFTEAAEEKGLSQFDGLIRENAQQMIEEGRRIFRFDTFGDEAFWGDTLKLHQAIACAGKGSFMAHPTHLLGRHKDEYVGTGKSREEALRDCLARIKGVTTKDMADVQSR
jgi:hypothetical protein